MPESFPFKSYTIAGIPIHHCTYASIISFLEQTIESKNCVQIATVAGETIVRANENSAFFNLLSNETLNTADGVGVQWAIEKLFNQNIDRITGVDLAEKLLQLAANKSYRVYLLGAKQATLAAAIANMKTRFPGLHIVGGRNGYFSEKDSEALAKEVSLLQVQILLVALGAPKQELWLQQFKKEINANVLMGVGGTFDVWSGNIKRAPKIIQQLRLEWLYRLFQDPKKFKRYYSLWTFLQLIKKQKKSEKLSN